MYISKERLHALAAPGVALKIAEIEQELATYHKEWPELFVSPTVPHLLKTPRRENGNGHWPIVATKNGDAAPTIDGLLHERKKQKRSGWTPERMERHRARLAAQPWGTVIWHRVHDYLASAPNRTATAADIMTHAKIDVQTSLGSAIRTHPELFDVLGTGMYRLKQLVTRHGATPATHGQKNKTKGEPAAGTPWGAFGWQRAHDYLKGVPNRTATMAEIRKAATINTSASFVTAYKAHPDVFARVGKGKYKLKKVLEH